ncbi:MAG: alpha/beta fold hydrolase, partial [Bacteroidia bacterium]|nr:alpha/beta fold hydrolase [Bacteroidia bacterium]
MKLHFTQLGTGFPLIILHGLFGSADNWTTLGKQFAQSFSTYLIDQRNHGRSPHTDKTTYP